MQANATLENAGAQAGNLGGNGGAGMYASTASIAFPIPRVNPPRPQPVPLWPARKLADLADCAQAILDGARLRPWERWALAVIRRRLLRAAGRMNP